MWLHQPWSVVREMTIREFRLHVLTANFWQAKKARAAEEVAQGA